MHKTQGMLEKQEKKIKPYKIVEALRRVSSPLSSQRFAAFRFFFYAFLIIYLPPQFN